MSVSGMQVSTQREERERQEGTLLPLLPEDAQPQIPFTPAPECQQMPLLTDERQISAHSMLGSEDLVAITCDKIV